MEDDIIKDEEDDLDIKLPADVDKVDALDDETESLDELEEEEDVEEPFDDVNPM